MFTFFSEVWWHRDFDSKFRWYKIIGTSQDSSIFKSLTEYIVVDVLNIRGRIGFSPFYRYPNIPTSASLDLFFSFLSFHKPLKKILIVGDVNIDGNYVDNVPAILLNVTLTIFVF